MNQQIRRYEYNRITDEIRNIDIIIKKTEASASRLRYQTGSDFIVAQLSKIKKANTDRRKRKDELSKRLEQLHSGLLDNELIIEAERQMVEAGEKSRATRQKKKELAADKEAKSVISKAYYQAGRREDRQNRYMKKNIDRSYRHFSRACSSIPDYMRRNLSEMPNNKGYFWKSVACYGDLPAEPGRPTVLFDRKRGGIMVIHEWTKGECKTYEKKGKDRKVLVSCTKRQPKNPPPICMEMLKREEEEAKRLSNRSHRRSSGRKSGMWRQRDNRQRDSRQRDSRQRDSRQRDNRNPNQDWVTVNKRVSRQRDSRQRDSRQRGETKGRDSRQRDNRQRGETKGRDSRNPNQDWVTVNKRAKSRWRPEGKTR